MSADSHGYVEPSKILDRSKSFDIADAVTLVYGYFVACVVDRAEGCSCEVKINPAERDAPDKNILLFSAALELNDRLNRN